MGTPTAAISAKDYYDVLAQQRNVYDTLYPSYPSVSTVGGLAGAGNIGIGQQAPSTSWPNQIPIPPRDERLDFLEHNRAALVEELTKVRRELADLQHRIINKDDAIVAKNRIVDWVINNHPEVWEEYKQIQKIKRRLTE